MLNHGTVTIVPAIPNSIKSRTVINALILPALNAKKITIYMINNAIQAVRKFHVILNYYYYNIFLDDGISFWLDSDTNKCIPCN